MPRRDGTPTEAEIAAQRRGQGPPPITTGVLPPAQAAAADLAATSAATAAAVAAPAGLGAILTPVAITTAAAGILGAFDRFLAGRRADQEQYVNSVLESEIPDFPEDARLDVVGTELDAERAFAAGIRSRLDRDLPKALAIGDKSLREAQVDKILDRERRYLEQREHAVAIRALGTAEARQVKEKSPEGGFWRLSPYVQEHTLDCLAMGNKVWPWSVLDVHRPPLHTGCACELWTIQEAQTQGLLHPGSLQTGDQVIHAMSIVEAEIDIERIEHELSILEAAWDEHWGKGTTKAGQFRPRRGGDPGRVLHRQRLARMPAMHAEAVTTIADHNDIHLIPRDDLQSGDRVINNDGELEHVTEVRSPGLVHLEHSGLVYFDREHVRGIAKDGPPTPEDRGLPQLPKVGDQDRYELRYGDNASLVMYDRQEHKPFAVWDGDWDLKSVEQALAEQNATHRASLKRAEPPPVAATGGSSHEDVLHVARMRRPAAAGELHPGFHFDPEISRSEARGDNLHLPPGFFKQSKAIREKVLFRHLGGKLADGLGPDGLKALRDQDPHLSSRKAVIDAYHALNSDARGQATDIHPDAMRLVATAAHERGLPLHPEAANLARRAAASDAAPDDHPAHDLARRMGGRSGVEVRDALMAAGYHFGGAERGHEGEPVALFHNHELGATITAHHDADGRMIERAAAEMAPPVPAEERNAIVGLNSREAIDHMVAAGYANNYTSSGDWLRFVHPDGRGTAVRVKDTGPKMEATHVAGFRPSKSEVTGARAVVVRADPLAHIKPGDDYRGAHNTLEGIASPWRATFSGDKPTGEKWVRYEPRAGNERPPVVIEYRAGADGDKVTAIGIGSADPKTPHAIVTAAQYDTERRAQQSSAERRAEEERQAQAETGTRIAEAVASGNQKALLAALGTGTVNDAARILRKHGFELRGRRRSGGYGPNRRMTYTLRGQNGETLKISGPNSFGGAVDKVAIEGNPQGGKRERLPNGQAPKNLKELLVDALGRADELGGRYGAAVHVTGIVQGGVSSGAAAHHEWNGTIAIRKSGEAKRITEYLRRRQKGEPLSENDHLGFYGDIETLQHEINHGVGKAGAGHGGLAFEQRHYSGLGKNVEEALTEETAHLLAVEWLRSHGMTDVLAAVKRNPNNHHVLGTYLKYRVQLKRILDDANVPEAERPALLERMKFQMSPEEQYAHLAQLAGADSLERALHAEPKRRTEMERNFQPAVRPDLSDVDASERVVLQSGRIVVPYEGVTVDTGDGRVPGIVKAIRGSDIKVEHENGDELWHDIRRIH